MIDYHVHPDYSIDAEDFFMRDYCAKAVDLGLKEICFTTHCEFDPSRSHLDWFVRCRGRVVPMHPVDGWLEAYLEEISECAREFSPQGLQVRAGLEAGYDLGFEEEIEKVINRYPFDFVIGSVHCLEHVAISSARESEKYFPGRTPACVGELYYKTLKEAVSTGLFDVIGHLDIYRRHGSKYLDKSIDEVYHQHIGEVLTRMVKTGTGLELNTSSWRHGQGSFYPNPAILREAVNAGIKYFTVGSDCHRLSELGLGIPQAVDTAHGLGINFSVYEKRNPKPL